jgi:twitching motility protein PilT
LYLEKATWPQRIRDSDLLLLLEALGKGSHDFTVQCHEHDAAIELGDERLRLNIFRHSGNLGMIARRIPKIIPDIDALGFPEIFKAQLLKVRGLFLITGPMRTGKSTTAAAGLNFINQQVQGHILTIEDPIEFPLTAAQCKITRREVGEDTESFASGGRAALRQDANVIFFGEIRDSATMRAALSAAEAGRLVIGTLHTKSAKETVSRINSFFQESDQEWARIGLANTLNCIVSQCLIPHTSEVNKQVMCYELLVSNSAIAKSIAENQITHIGNAMVTGKSHGHVTLNSTLAEKVRLGEITREMAMHYAYDLSGLMLELS